MISILRPLESRRVASDTLLQVVRIGPGHLPEPQKPGDLESLVRRQVFQRPAYCPETASLASTSSTVSCGNAVPVLSYAAPPKRAS